MAGIKKLSLTLVLFLVTASFIAGGCVSRESEDTTRFTGTVRYVQLEGGFHGIISGKGVKYDPVNLPERFERDGLKVRVRGRIRREVPTIRMWGVPLEIIEIRESQAPAR